MEALETLEGIARSTGSVWYGQWDGRFVMIVQAKDGAAAEVQAVKVGRLDRYQCGSKNVLVLKPHASIINAHVAEALRELRLLPQIQGDGVVVAGPRHVLESASARMRMHGVRAVMHGRELKVRA